MPPWQSAPVEPPLLPHLPIIDPHHHFWGPGHGGSEMFGRFLPSDVVAEFQKCGHRIIASVYLECGWAYRATSPQHLSCVGETEFVEAAGEEFSNANLKLAAGIVARADLSQGEAVAEILEAHLAASPKLRGIRDMLAYDPEEHNFLNTPPEKSRGTKFRAGFAQLEKYGLTFDAWAYHPQLGEIVELANAFPNTKIILNHCGGPIHTGRFAGKRAEVFADWAASITALSRCPNVTIKLGGLGMHITGFNWHEAATPPDSATLATAFRPTILHAIDAFSPARCMFESNFAVDGLSYAYGTLWNAFKRLTKDFSIPEQNDLFSGTAARVYRLEL